MPPSAWITSQSIQIVRSPSSFERVDRAQRAADQPLDLLRAAADLAGRRFALRARRGRARQHAVFRGDPALAGVAQERRHAILDAGRADDARAADLDQDRAFGVREEAGVMRRRTQVARRAAIASVHHHLLVRLDPLQLLLERMAQVDVAGERVDFLAVDQDLHPLIAGRFTVSALTMRVDGEELVERAAGVLAPAPRRSDRRTPRPCRS